MLASCEIPEYRVLPSVNLPGTAAAGAQAVAGSVAGGANSSLISGGASASQTTAGGSAWLDDGTRAVGGLPNSDASTAMRSSVGGGNDATPQSAIFMGGTGALLETTTSGGNARGGSLNTGNSSLRTGDSQTGGAQTGDAQAGSTTGGATSIAGATSVSMGGATGAANASVGGTAGTHTAAGTAGAANASVGGTAGTHTAAGTAGAANASVGGTTGMGSVPNPYCATYIDLGELSPLGNTTQSVPSAPTCYRFTVTDLMNRVWGTGSYGCDTRKETINGIDCTTGCTTSLPIDRAADGYWYVAFTQGKSSNCQAQWWWY